MPELPEIMRAVLVAAPRRAGGSDASPPRRARPRAPAKSSIKVEAAGVNRPTSCSARAVYPPPPGASDILGLEVAGEVVALGPGASRHALGARVAALVAGGGYAEYCVAHESNALPIPAGLSAVEAAAIPETFFTVWTNVFERGALKAGETLLVHGGSSGIGTTAIQLAKAFGARVVATAGSDEKVRECVALGADRAVNYRTEDFVAATLAATDGKGADVILDMVGGDYVARNYAAAAIDGRIVQIAFLQRTEGRDRPARRHGQAALSHRLDAASALGCGKSGDRRGAARKGLAAAGSGALQAGDRFALSARRGGRGAPAHAKARRMSARSC